MAKKDNEQIVATALQRGLADDLRAIRADITDNKAIEDRIRNAFLETLGGKRNVTLVTALENGEEVADATESGGNIPKGVDDAAFAQFAISQFPALAQFYTDEYFPKKESAVSLKVNTKWVENPIPAPQPDAEVEFSN